MIYNKLVRDKIPQLMQAQGKFPRTQILTGESLHAALEAKLDEETAEFHRDRNLEELADIYEVLLALAAAQGFSGEDLENARQEKRARRGGFREGIFLISDGEQ